PHEVYPADFRCEKLDEGQVKILRSTGLADLVLPEMARADELCVARFGRLLDRKPGIQHGMMYDALVNTLRGAIPAHVPFVRTKVASVATSIDRQELTLANGEAISARLVVLAVGLNPGLRHALGLARTEISHCHSISAGFDIRPVDRTAFEFPALTYYAERPTDKAAYLTLFPVPGAMRANYMCYRGLADPWILKLRKSPHAALVEVMPNLEKAIGRFEVAGEMRIRPADLYVTENYLQPGIVLVGDAFSTSCPAAGTGAGKVLTDVACLCNTHIPNWLKSAGMDTDKLAAFYADPSKRAYDAGALDRAFELRATSIDPGLRWAARRWVRFLGRGGVGIVRRAGERLRLGPLPGDPRPRTVRHV
ncbi:MAG TPA: FAD-dependent monooxygenase, partial [Alphaproteobacteria bacterium]